MSPTGFYLTIPPAISTQWFIDQVGDPNSLIRVIKVKKGYLEPVAPTVGGAQQGPDFQGSDSWKHTCL
jgi:hypothetical protein